MNRRGFIKTSVALPAAVAVSGLPRIGTASTPGPWRVFEVTTSAEILKPAGATRVWLPVPLTADTPYQKSLGNSWSADGGKISYSQDAKYGMGIVHAEFPGSAKSPKLVLVSRFATGIAPLTFPGLVLGRWKTPRRSSSILQPTELIPTDGIVRDTAREITKGAGTDIDKARAIYEWVVDNTFRDPKVRGCGWGDIKTMLETRNFGGKCGDLNALFVGLARSVGIPARDVYGVRVARSQLRLREPGRGHGKHHPRAALPRGILRAGASAGYRWTRRTCARSCWRSRRATSRSTARRSSPRANGCLEAGR